MSFGSEEVAPNDQYMSYGLSFTVDGEQVNLQGVSNESIASSGPSDAAIQRVIDVLNADPGITFVSGSTSYAAYVSRTITAT